MWAKAYPQQQNRTKLKETRKKDEIRNRSQNKHWKTFYLSLSLNFNRFRSVYRLCAFSSIFSPLLECVRILARNAESFFLYVRPVIFGFLHIVVGCYFFLVRLEKLALFLLSTIFNFQFGFSHERNEVRKMGLNGSPIQYSCWQNFMCALFSTRISDICCWFRSLCTKLMFQFFSFDSFSVCFSSLALCLLVGRASEYLKFISRNCLCGGCQASNISRNEIVTTE